MIISPSKSLVLPDIDTWRDMALSYRSEFDTKLRSSLFRIKRFQSPQTIAWSANGKATLPEGIEKQLPISSIDLHVTGRLNISAQTGAGTFFPECPSTILRRVRIVGSRNDGKGNVTLYDARGESIRIQSVYYKGIWPRMAGITPLGSTSVANFDFRIVYHLPLAAEFPAKTAGVAEGAGGSLIDFYRTVIDPARFSQIQLEVTWGSTPNHFISGGTGITSALQDYGSASGTPTLRYVLHQPILAGAQFGTHYISRVERQANLSTVVGATATRVLLTGAGDIPVGNMIKSIMLRQYQENSGNEGLVDQASGASLFLGLPTTAGADGESTIGIKRVYLMRNANIPDWEAGWNKLVDYNRGVLVPAVNRPSITSIDDDGMPDGYALIDFAADSGSLEDAYDLRRGFPPNKIQLYVDTIAIPATVSRTDVLYQEVVEF